MFRYYANDTSFRELMLEYITIIKNIQDLSNDSILTPYALETSRVEKHREIEEYLKLDSPFEKERLKDLLSKMDYICKRYSDCEEWKLQDDRDVKRMTRYICDFISSYEGEIYITCESGILRDYKNG